MSLPLSPIRGRGATKWPKKAMTEIVHVARYACRIQNGPFIFPFQIGHFGVGTITRLKKPLTKIKMAHFPDYGIELLQFEHLNWFLNIFLFSFALWLSVIVYYSSTKSYNCPVGPKKQKGSENFAEYNFKLVDKS